MFAAPASGWLGDWLRRKRLLSRARFSGAWPLSHRLCSHLLGPFRAARAGSVARPPSVSMPGRARRFLSGTRPQPHPLHLLSGHSVGAALGYLAVGTGQPVGMAQAFLLCAIPGLIIAALYGYGPRAGARWKDRYRVCRRRGSILAALERIVKRRLRWLR